MDNKAIIAIVGIMILGALTGLVYGLVNLGIWLLGAMLFYPVTCLIILTALCVLGLILESLSKSNPST